MGSLGNQQLIPIYSTAREFLVVDPGFSMMEQIIKTQGKPTLLQGGKPGAAGRGSASGILPPPFPTEVNDLYCGKWIVVPL